MVPAYSMGPRAPQEYAVWGPMSGYAVTRLDEIDEVNDGRCPVPARPAPLRDHVVRRQHVDGEGRGRPDHQRARRGRRERGALSRLSTAARRSSSTASGWTRPPARSCSPAPASSGRRSPRNRRRRSSRSGRRRARRTSPPALRSGRRSAGSTRPAKYAEAADLGRELAEAHPEYAGPALQRRLLREPRRADSRRDRAPAARDRGVGAVPRVRRRATRTSIRSRTSRRSSSSWGDAARLDLGQVSWEDAHMRSIAALSVEMSL